MTERLVRINLKDGTHIDMLRDEDKTVRVCHEDHEVSIPHATGQLTTGIFALLEPMGEIELEEDTDE